MEPLTLEALQKAASRPEVFPVTFLGHQSYIRMLTYDEQIEIANKYGLQEDPEAVDVEAKGDDIKVLLATALCDELGQPIFPEPESEETLKLLGALPGDELMNVFDQIKAHNATDTEVVVKN